MVVDHNEMDGLWDRQSLGPGYKADWNGRWERRGTKAVIEKGSWTGTMTYVCWRMMEAWARLLFDERYEYWCSAVVKQEDLQQGSQEGLQAVWAMNFCLQKK